MTNVCRLQKLMVLVSREAFGIGTFFSVLGDFPLPHRCVVAHTLRVGGGVGGGGWAVVGLRAEGG